MRFYVRGCSNLETLTRDEQKTLCKKFVEPLLWSQVLFHSGDDMSQKIKRIEETFETLQPMFARKIQFLDMRIMKDEGKFEWAMRVTEMADLAYLESIKAQELMFLK